MNGNLITENLFDEVLIDPARHGADELYIVSGYASSAMAFHHAQKLLEQDKPDVTINLIIGMTSRDGLSHANHNGFKALMSETMQGQFHCSYLTSDALVHSKVFLWKQSGQISDGYLGSANYSQQAFIGGQQQEVMAKCNPNHAFDYYQSLIGSSIYCTHQDAEFVTDRYRQFNAPTQNNTTSNSGNQNQAINGLDPITVSFINRNNIVSVRSGLNWGQRPSREPNQAYIPLRATIYNSSFFPPVGQHFTVNADDGAILLCVRAQQNGKAIETPDNNSRLGEYFRRRLGLANGEFVTREHFLNYGRSDATFYKIDAENYYMDFSV